jgi:hypothetical protein
MTLRFRELEHTSLYAGLGLRLVDVFTGTGPLGWVKVQLDVGDSGAWREIERPAAVTAGGVIWFPWLEHYADASGRTPRLYRARVAAEWYAPRYGFDSDGVTTLVVPYDDRVEPATPPRPLDVLLLPSAGYPFAPAVPLLRGAVTDALGAPVEAALVTWRHDALDAESALSDADGEFTLPMRRAPKDTSIAVRAERPAPPPGGTSGEITVRVPQDLATFQTIQIL